eukprot:4083081-Amphidinium_carterae.1
MGVTCVMACASLRGVVMVIVPTFDERDTGARGGIGTTTGGGRLIGCRGVSSSENCEMGSVRLPRGPVKMGRMAAGFGLMRLLKAHATTY